jgi:hypothetical protein
LAHAAKAAFVHGITLASLVGAAVVSATAVAAYFFLPDAAAPHPEAFVPPVGSQARPADSSSPWSLGDPSIPCADPST